MRRNSSEMQCQVPNEGVDVQQQLGACRAHLQYRDAIGANKHICGPERRNKAQAAADLDQIAEAFGAPGCPSFSSIGMRNQYRNGLSCRLPGRLTETVVPLG